MSGYRVALLTSYFPPDINSSAHLYHDLAIELGRRGHRVKVITGYPRHNIERAALDPRYRRGFRLVENLSGVEVVRLRRIPLPLQVPVFRGIDHLLQPLVLGAELLLSNFRPDVLLYYSPPLPHCLAAAVVRRTRHIRVVMNVQDIFPRYAVAVGVLRNPMLIRLFERLERFAYRTADALVVHSDGNARWIGEHHAVPSRKLHVIRNWIRIDERSPDGRRRSFREMLRLAPGDFLVSYAGVMGYAQDLDTVLEAANLLRHRREIRFLLVGTGVEKERLVRMAGRRGLDNVEFLPMQPREKYTEILDSSDVSLVTLRKDIDTPVVPGKLQSIMAAGCPVLASVPPRNDTVQLVRESGCGLVVEAGDARGLAVAIEALAANRPWAEELGRAGRRFSLANFDVQAAASRYEEIFERLCAPNRQAPTPALSRTEDAPGPFGGDPS